MDKMKKLMAIKIKEKWVAVLAVMGMLGLLAPLFRLGMYAVPYYDDYLHVRFVKNFVVEYGGLGAWWQGVLYTVKSQYYAWQGTYSTQFIVSASPLLLDDKYYSYVVLFVLLLFIVSVMAAVVMLTKRLMKMTTGGAWITAVIVTMTLLELIYTAQQGVYWYNAEVHYTLMHGLLLLTIAVSVEILYAKSCKRAVVLSIAMAILGIIVAGSNYVTILQGELVLLTIILLGFLKKNKKTWFLVTPVLLYTFGFYMNVNAPGNQKRGAAYQGCGVMESVLLSFKSGAEQFVNFTGLILVVIMLLLVPVVWNAVRNMEYEFRLPGLVTLYSVCLYATGFTSSYYAMGTPGLSRTWVVIKFTLQLLFFVNEIYWIGWFVKKRQKQREVQCTEHYLSYYGMLCLMMLGIFALSDNKIGEFSSYGAYHYIHSGEAYNFHQQYEERIEKIKNGGSVVELEPYAWRPYFLCMGELSTDPNAEQNMSLAQWYGKKAVYIAVKEE